MQQPPELSYEQSLLQSDFDYTKLTEFNTALVYGFECEGSLVSSKRNPENVEYILHSIGQYQDMYNAYKYAQDVIIPEAKQTGLKNITPELVIHWLEQIHKRIAATLAKDVADAGLKGVVAGACSQRLILRWHQGADISPMLINYLSGFAPPDANMAHTLAERGIELQTAIEFMKILNKVAKNKSIEIPESEKRFINMSNPLLKGTYGINRLAVAYHNKILSPNERKCVDKVVSICALPSELPKLRQEFAVNFIAKLQSTDPDNNGSVAELVFYTFREITSRHWWFNANGRAATCFLNTALRLFGRRSILVRNPNEKGTATSSYSKAIAMIDKEPRLLFNHLATRIEETEQGNFYNDPREEEYVLLRVKLGKMILRVKLEFSGFKLDAFVNQKYQTIAAEISSVQRAPGETTSRLLQGLLKSVTELHAKLTELKNKSFISDLAKNSHENKATVPVDSSQNQPRP